MVKEKKLSNSFSTGSGGAHFEAHIQSSFVALMLSGGYAPCLPCWPISEIKLQGKIDGFNVDDLIVFVKNEQSKEKRKLIAQIKHSIGITKKNQIFGEVIHAAWNDFNNIKVFNKHKDVIALITGPINKTDSSSVKVLLEKAKYSKDAEEFFKYIKTSKACSNTQRNKLEVFQHHLFVANNNITVSDDETYSFLNHFHWLGYDLGSDSGVVMSLLQSHISLFNSRYPQWILSRIVDVVQTWNQNAGTITKEKLPEDLKEAFVAKEITKIPDALTNISTQKTNAYSAEVSITKEIIDIKHKYATDIALASFVGCWNEKQEDDIKTIEALTDEEYASWVLKIRELLQLDKTPFIYKNGVWSIKEREQIIPSLSSLIFNNHIDKYKELLIDVLTEKDPAFELPKEDRYAANIYGKTKKYSDNLRIGIANGLAILGCNANIFINCDLGKVENSIFIIVKDILETSGWVSWGSLNDLLPILAEASPNAFLTAVENALQAQNCPFNELFAQEGNGIMGRNYMTGLLWALETLAWEESHLVRCCSILADLSMMDSGGNWANRPINSLKTILLPWLPQTLATIEKRIVAVNTIKKEQPSIAWNLIINFLPTGHQVSSGSRKPVWRKYIPENWENKVSRQEYNEQIEFYSDLAVNMAINNSMHLKELIENLDHLTKQPFDKILNYISSKKMNTVNKEIKFEVWQTLSGFISRHRRYSDAKWALDESILKTIEKANEKIKPSNPSKLYNFLFTDRAFDLYEYTGNWEEQQKRIQEQKIIALNEIIDFGGLDLIMSLMETVDSPYQLGITLGKLSDIEKDKFLFPKYLNETYANSYSIIDGYIFASFHKNSWEWVDSFEENDWDITEKAVFLVCLPFENKAWLRVDKWLGDNDFLYWKKANAFTNNDENIDYAIDKLIKYDRPYTALNCLYFLYQDKKNINVNKVVEGLIAALNTKEQIKSNGFYHLTNLIQYLQNSSETKEEDLFRIEWAYLSLLDGHHGAVPKLLGKRLSINPEFYCEIIQLVYRSKNKNTTIKEPTEKEQTIASNAWTLLNGWKTPPGIIEDSSFNKNAFETWIKKVKEICEKSGHFDVAMHEIGKVLFFSPADSTGLWIDKNIANILNQREMKRMRDGYCNKVYNSRGVHTIDPKGTPEKDLAKNYREKAVSVENEGFQRLATALKSIAVNYDRDAERIIDEHKREESSD